MKGWEWKWSTSAYHLFSLVEILVGASRRWDDDIFPWTLLNSRFGVLLASFSLTQCGSFLNSEAKKRGRMQSSLTAESVSNGRSSLNYCGEKSNDEIGKIFEPASWINHFYSVAWTKSENEYWQYYKTRMHIYDHFSALKYVENGWKDVFQFNNKLLFIIV